MKRLLVPVLVAAVLGPVAFILLSPKAPAAIDVPQVSSEKSPRLLVLLLDYLAVDYAGAVKNGVIVSEAEYKEQVEFVQNAVDLSRNLPEISSSGIEESTSKLSALIHSKADPAEVSKLAREIQKKTIELVGLRVAPAQWPNLEAAKPLFKETCSKCHGPEGAGDGPSAANLETKPVNFQDPLKMREMTPFQAFNTIRLGVPKTPMASFASYSDRDTWNLAFYVISLRYRKHQASPAIENAFKELEERLQVSSSDHLLTLAATGSDASIEERLDGSAEAKSLALASLRLHSRADSPGASLELARSQLESAGSDYQAKLFENAASKALSAYIDGVEPVEIRLKAADPAAVLHLEQSMALVRSAIHQRKEVSEVAAAIRSSEEALDQATSLLGQQKASPSLTFTLALGILVREGFEAALVIVALLSVIRVSSAKTANRWVHGGWLVAVGFGGIAWIFSGWLTNRGGVQREMMEGMTGLVTVLILLYLGFWLHSKTEITKWKNFIQVQIQSAVNQRNVFRLAFISFLAAFREAIETVLFLRAIWLEGGSESKLALAAGVVTAFGLILVMGWVLLTFSTRIPVRTLFSVSSVVMVVLAVILTGKAVHAFQEIDMVSITLSPVNLHWDWLGLFPTRESLLAQLMILALSLSLWIYGKRSPAEGISSIGSDMRGV